MLDVHELHSSVEIWNRLKSRLLHASMARSMELKGRLSHMKKPKQQTMEAFLLEIKFIVDSLAAIQCSVSQYDLVEYTLSALDRDRDYDALVTILVQFQMSLSFDDLRPKLLQHEQCIQAMRAYDETPTTHLALVVVQSGFQGPNHLPRVVRTLKVKGMERTKIERTVTKVVAIMEAVAMEERVVMEMQVEILVWVIFLTSHCLIILVVIILLMICLQQGVILLTTI